MGDGRWAMGDCQPAPGSAGGDGKSLGAHCRQDSWSCVSSDAPPQAPWPTTSTRPTCRSDCRRDRRRRAASHLPRTANPVSCCSRLKNALSQPNLRVNSQPPTANRQQWTLASVYRQPKPELLKALRALLVEPMFAFEHRAAVQAAVDAFEAAGCGFADCLIVAKNQALRCTSAGSPSTNAWGACRA